MSEQKQGSDDREKNARDGANPVGDYLPPPALPPGFRSSFFDLKDRTAAISALGKALSDCAAVERSLGVLEDVWLKHEEKKECLVNKAREVSALQDEIGDLRQQHESRRQAFEERETHAKSQRLEIANDLKECSESIIGLAQDMGIELHTRIIKAPSRRQISRDDALEKYIDKWLPMLDDHLDALWSEMRMRVYGHQAQLLSGRIIPLEHARRLGLEGWLNRIEALSHRVNYYIDVSSALCSRQDTITKHRNKQRKIREEILSKEVQCATLEDELIQFRAESKTVLHVQQGAARQIKEQLGTLCDELLVVLGKLQGPKALLARESRECELLIKAVKENVTRVSSPEIGKFLGLATDVLKEARAITAWLDLGENLGVFETCKNPNWPA